MDPYTIDLAMVEALNHLKRVAGHLRSHGQYNAANKVGQLGVSLLEVVRQGAVNIPITQHIIAISDEQVASPCSGDYGNHLAMTHRSPNQDVYQQQVVAALRNEVEKEQKSTEHRALNNRAFENRAFENRAPQHRAPENRMLENRTPENRAPEIRAPSSRALEKRPVRNELVTQPSSWAKVASSSQLQTMNPVVPGSSRDPAQFMSPTSMTTASLSGSKNNHHGGDDKAQGELIALSPSQATEPSADETKAGVIRVHGKISRDTIAFITTRIHEGPLQEIRVESNVRTRVVFQFVSHALAFLNSDQEMINRLGYGRFGRGYTVEMAEVLDWNEDFFLMNQPIRERRRLSFARKGLFSSSFSADRWRQDIQSAAGAGNIDFTWVFNTGNATAVFTSTIVARKVLDQVNRWKEGRAAYYGASVTYSSDPCEKELVLVKETKRPHAGHGYRHRRR